MEYKKWMCYIDGQKKKYSVLNECNRMLKYNIREDMLQIEHSDFLIVTLTGSAFWKLSWYQGS
jgi:hypothetical protein